MINATNASSRSSPLRGLRVTKFGNLHSPAMFVIPAKAGIQEHGKDRTERLDFQNFLKGLCSWIPAFAGMTKNEWRWPILSATAAFIVAFFARRARRGEERKGWVRTAITLPILALALIAAGLPPADDAAIRAAIRGIYAPYNAPSDAETPMEQRIYSAGTQVLLDRWTTVAYREGEITSLSESDWLCQCQDWDPETFRVTGVKLQPLARGKVRADVSLLLARGSPGKLRLIITRERGKWLIDDLVAINGYPTLMTGLRREIAEAGGSR
jgi:Protein of unknown function (DUF3828)